MTSCIGISLLSCRALKSVVGGGGGRFFFLCLYFFASGGSSHGSTLFGPCDDHVLPSSLSLSQLERTRAVHVTSHSTAQAIEARGGGARHRSLLAYIIHKTHLPSCQTSRRTDYLFSLVPAVTFLGLFVPRCNR